MEQKQKAKRGKNYGTSSTWAFTSPSDYAD